MSSMKISSMSRQQLMDVGRREIQLTEHNGKHAVRIVGFVDDAGHRYADAEKMARAFADGCNKYLVTERPGAVRELRVGDGADGGTHDRMILPDEGERLIGASYYRYYHDRAVLELYGQSGSFPMRHDALDLDEYILAAHPCGLTAVQSAITAILPLVTIRATVSWSFG